MIAPSTQVASSNASTARVGLWAAVVVFLTLRLALVMGLEVTQWSDLQWYFERALELLATGRFAEHGVPTAYWPVGYPAFLAAVMGLSVQSELAGQLANVALSLASLFMMYAWCLREFGSPRVATTSALLLAVYPNHMGYSVGLYSEPLFTVLLLGIFLLTRPDASLMRVAAAGVVAGAASLVKAQGMLLGPLLLLVLSLPRFDWTGLRQAALRAILGSLLMCLTIAPWTSRNWEAFNRFIPVSTNGGMSLLAANNPAMTTSLSQDYDDTHPMVAAVGFSVADQADADRRAKAAAWQWIGDNPGRFLLLMPKKFFRLWASDGESEWLFQSGYSGYEQHRTVFRTLRWVNQVFYAALLLGAMFAMLRWSRWSRPSSWAVPAMLAYFSLISMVFSGQSRYHAPMMPFIIGYAAWAWVHWRNQGAVQAKTHD